MTPGCSVCGYVVEVVRSCFKSRWRLFKGRPETTAGQYIFADEDAPIYDGWHLLWSRDWVSDELDGATLGEDPTAKRGYALGGAIGPVPPPALLGDATCIAEGERWPLPVVPVLVGGFPTDCFAGVPAQTPTISVTDPGNWCWWAGIIVRTYTDAAGARAEVAARLGVPVSGWVEPNPQSLMPANFGLVPPAGAPIVVVLAGTDNATQWINQILFGIGPPRTFAEFKTNPIWYTDSSILLGVMALLGLNPTQDIVIVGHSLGAAVACVLAARLRLGNAERRIQLLTLGCPRPGDARLAALLSTMEVVTLQNDGDIVIGIPSNLSDIPPQFQFLVRIAYPAGSAIWVPAPNRQRIAWNGTVSAGAADPGLQEAINAIWLWSINEGPFPDLSPHLQGEYERRLCRPAPAPVAWADAQASALGDGSLVSVLPNLADMTNGFTFRVVTGQTPQLHREQDNFLTALIFRSSTGLFLQHPVCVDTDWEFFAVVDVVRELGDTGKDVLDAPIGDATGGIGPSWSGASSSTGECTIKAGLVGASVPFAGDNGAPVLLSGSLCAGTVLARLETGIDVHEATAINGTPSFNGFNSIGYEFHSTSTLPYPQLWLGEVLLYEGCLTSEQRDSVLAYLRIKWLLHLVGMTTEGGILLTTEGGEILVTE